MSEDNRDPVVAGRLERLRQLLASAVQIPAQERAAYLRARCSDDEALVQEAQTLLELHESAAEFLSLPFPELVGAKPRVPAELPAGTLLKGRYRLALRISQTDFATVYWAADELIGEKKVVVKILDRLHDETVLRETFASELRSLSRVQHPNVVGLSDIGTLDEGTPFLVLTYVPGVTLREVLGQSRLSPLRARRILQGIGKALAAAHKAGIWHLDIKPENVIISEPDSDEERVTLIDFGIARLKNLPGASYSAGSPRYMAPEQDVSPSAQSDIYALALVAFELSAGHLPKTNLNLQEQLPPSLGKRSAQAIAKGLNSNPSDRFASVSEFLDGLHIDNSGSRIFTRRPKAVILGVSILLAIAYFWFARPRALTEYKRPVPIVSTHALEQQPAFSPDGQEVYYTVGEKGSQDIYKTSLSGGDPVLVVGHSEDNSRPQVSPDGKRLMFIRRGVQTEIIQKSLPDGREETVIAGVDVDDYSWSADGKKIILAGIVDGGRQKLRVAEIATGKIETLQLQGASDCAPNHPRVSPDGKTLAFACRWSPGSDDLFIAAIGRDLSTVDHARRITNQRERIDSQEWAPDSQSIFYVRVPLGSGSVWRARLDDSDDPVNVSVIGEQIESIAIPLRKWRIAYSSQYSDTNLWLYEPAGDKPPRQVAASSYPDEQGYFSPDGKMLLFGSGRSGKAQIWISGADGADARQLTNVDSADVIAVIWAQNSKEAIVSVRSKQAGECIYRVAIHGAASMVPVFKGAMAASVSRDGRWLYIVKSEGANRSIWRTSYPDATNSELIVEGGAFGLESTDSQSFYFSKRNEMEGLWRQPLPRGTASQVTGKLYRRNLFAVSKAGVYFIAPTVGTAFPSLFFKSFQSDQPRPLISFEREIGWGLGLTPDERTLLYSQVDIGNSDIMLIEQFR